MKRRGVVGCGVMGAGIAEVGAKAGCDVIVVDALPDALDRAQSRMAASLAKAEEKGVNLDQLTQGELQAIDDRLDERALDVLTLEASVASRTSLGGTAPIRVRDAIAAARTRLD